MPLIAFLGGMMFASLAMIFTALVPNIDSFNYPFFLLITPMFLFSGTFFPLDVAADIGPRPWPTPCPSPMSASWSETCASTISC